MYRAAATPSGTTRCACKLALHVPSFSAASAVVQCRAACHAESELSHCTLSSLAIVLRSNLNNQDQFLQVHIWDADFFSKDDNVASTGARILV